MDHPVLHSPLEFDRILVDCNDHFRRRGLYSGPPGRQNELGGVVEDGMIRSYELRVMDVE